MTRTNQGGSVLGFVVAAVLMTGLLIGGAYTVRQLTAQPEPTQAANKPQEQKTSQNPAKEDEKKTQEKNSAPADDTAQTETTLPGSGAQELPQTGPESLVGSAVILAILSGMAVSYARSRRPELSL